MNKILIIIFLLNWSLIAASCNPDRPATFDSQSSSDTPLSYQLPVKEVSINGHSLNVEIAATDSSRQQGLSNRQSLDYGQGMLFDFTQTDQLRPGFWMKDMNFSIDIIWIRQNKIVDIDRNVPHQATNINLPTYYPDSDITHVLEVPAGWSEQHNVNIGDEVNL